MPARPGPTRDSSFSQTRANYPSHPCRLCKPHYPHLAKWLAPSKNHPAGGGWGAGLFPEGGSRMPPHSRPPLPAALSSTPGPSGGLAHTLRQARVGQRRRSPQAPQLPLPTTSAPSANKRLLRARHGLRGSGFIRGPSEQTCPQSSARLLTTRLVRGPDSCHRTRPLLRSAVLTQPIPGSGPTPHRRR